MSNVLSLLARPLVTLYQRHRVEAELSELDDRMLSDIGITRADIKTVAFSAGLTGASKPTLGGFRRPQSA